MTVADKIRIFLLNVSNAESVANDKHLEAGDKTIDGDKILEYNSNKVKLGNSRICQGELLLEI